MDQQFERQYDNTRTEATANTDVVRIDLPLTPFTLRSLSVGVSHNDTPLLRGLDLGEHVLLRDPEARTYFTAVVADVDFTIDDTLYRLQLGTRITSGEAAEWLSPVRERPAGGMTTRDVAQLLTALRRSQQGLLEAYRDYTSTTLL